MANNAATYHHVAAVHPVTRGASNRCVCGGLNTEHFRGTGYCNHCAAQCPTYRVTSSATLAWMPGYE